MSYVRTDRGSIAYQLWGEGPVEHLLLSEFSTSVDNIWEHPRRVRILSAQGQIARTVRFDPLGQGASDPVALADVGRVDLWRDQALAVLDAVGFNKVVVTAEGFASQVGMLLGSERPERVQRLALLNPFARLTRAEGYPIGHDVDVDRAVAYVRSVWGTGEITGRLPTLATGAPDPSFPGRNERLGASPEVAASLVAACYGSDVRGLLPSVRVPTLVIHTGELPMGSWDMSRYVADQIPGSLFLDVPSRSFYWGEGGFSSYAEFVGGAPLRRGERIMKSILFTDIVDSTSSVVAVGDSQWKERLGYFDDFVSVEVDRHGGTVIKHTGGGHLLAFDSPDVAVRAAVGILRGAPTLDVTVRAGIHTGEVEQRTDGDIVGIAVNIAARVASHASANQLLVSQTVADLLAGGEFSFLGRGTHQLKGVPGNWSLYEVPIG